MKEIKHAISVVIQNEKGEVLFALRSPNKTEFPLVWSLPSHFMLKDETAEDTIKRIGRYKLGVELALVRLLNEGYGDRPDFTLFMHDYEVRVVSGTPSIHSDDFVELKWTDPEKQLSSMEVMGDCCRLYKEYLTRGEH